MTAVRVFFRLLDTLRKFLTGSPVKFEALTELSRLYRICLNTQPILVAIGTQDGVYDVSGPNLEQEYCASYFSKYDCSSLDFTRLGVPIMTSYNAATIGKPTLSNTNTRTLTSPVYGTTFPWTDLGISYTVTAARIDARAATETSSSGRATVTSAGATGVTKSNSTSASTSSAYRDVISEALLAGTSIMTAAWLLITF